MTTPKTDALMALADRYAFHIPGSQHSDEARAALLAALQEQAQEGEAVANSAILARGRFHAFKGEDGEPDDWEWFEEGTNCEHGCIDAVIVRARNFPNFPIGYHIPEVFAAVGETPPEPTYEAEQVGKYICPVRTVADLVNNLKLMDQTLPIYGAQYIEHLGKSRCIATPPTVSRERIKDSRWIGEGDTLNAAVIWTRAEQPPQPAAQEPTSAVPVVEQLVGALSRNRIMAADSDGNYTREVTPRVITAAIAAGQKYLKENGK